MTRNVNASNERWQKLLAAQAAGQLTSAQQSEMSELLGQSDALLNEYVESILLDVSLEREFSSSLAGESTVRQLLDQASAASPSAGGGGPEINRRHASKYFANPRAISLAVATLVVCLIVAIMAIIGPPVYRSLTRSNEEPVSDQYRIVAELTGLQDAVWADEMNSAHRGAYLVAGRRIALSRGFVEVTFREGARCVFTGPCEVVLDDTNRLTLLSGTLAATVHEDAVGFRVDTPSGSVTDLGTQFGVTVRPNGGEDVHVFKGQVDVHWPAVGNRPEHRARLAAGESLTLSPGLSAPKRQSASLAGFALHLPIPEPIAQWTLVGDQVRNAHGNELGQLSASAHIEDNMLVLTSDDAFAMLPDPIDKTLFDGGYTISLWVRPGKIRSQNILVRTNDAGPAANYSHQLLMDEEGHFVHYTFDGGGRWVISDEAAHEGQWYFLTLTAQAGGPMKLYVDGRLSASWQGPLGKLWSEGNCFYAGNWSRSVQSNSEIPAIDGSLRDICIYSVPISAGAVQQLYEEAVSSLPQPLPE